MVRMIHETGSPELPQLGTKIKHEGKSNKILIIDNDSVVRHFLQRMLHLQGYDCEEVTCDEVDLEKMKVHQPRLIIVDGEISSGMGIHFLKTMATDSYYKLIPVILLTKTEPSKLDGSVENLRDCTVLQKPLDYKQISVAVASVLGDYHG